MSPKSKKEILDTCQKNFWGYSTFTKVLIVISVVLSAATLALYLCGYVLPTADAIICGDVTGWNIVWRVGLAVLLYIVTHFANLLFVSIGGAAMCEEEGWDTIDFAKAWVDMYEYEEYLKNKDFKK